MKTIIVADLNNYNASYQNGEAYTNGIDEMVLQLKSIIRNKVFYVKDFEELNSQLEKLKGQDVIFFSNFPANITFKRFEIFTSDKSNYYKADSYSLSFKLYSNIIEKYRNVELHIVTGASSESFTDTDIINMSNRSNIYIKRKRDWNNYSTTDFLEYIQVVLTL